MLKNRNEIEPHQVVSGIAARLAIEFIGDFLNRVAPLAATTKVHQLPVFLGIPRKRGKASGVGIGVKVDDGTH